MDALRELLRAVRSTNAFYRAKLPAAVDTLAELPFTTKQELAENQRQVPPYGSNLTYDRSRYIRLHQTSGTTTGTPLRWLDTAESWEWLLTCWQISFAQIGLRADDVLFFPFSFGPFLGFWTAFEAATRAGYLCLAGGGMPSTARLKFLLDHRASILFATPTYALHLAEVAANEGIDIRSSSMRLIIVAGEPGGNIPETRDRIASAWGASVVDHYGMTEVGPVAFETNDSPTNLTILHEHYLAEVLSPTTLTPVAVGEVGELVLTNLGRVGSPVIRYRTGDLVRWGGDHRLLGGVLGRADDMLHIRGNNVYPAAIEAILRRISDVVEYRLVIDHSGPLADLHLEIEPAPHAAANTLADRVAQAIQDELLFRTSVQCVANLPRFEMKAKRIVHRKNRHDS